MKFIFDLNNTTNTDISNIAINEILESACNYMCNLHSLQCNQQLLLDIALLSNEEIMEINNSHRNINSPTDILSFPFVNINDPEELKALAQDGDQSIFGNILLSPEYIKSAAVSLGVSFESHLRRVLVHGVVHLFGYDHHSEEEALVMLTHEKYILQSLGASIDALVSNYWNTEDV